MCVEDDDDDDDNVMILVRELKTKITIKKEK